MWTYNSEELCHFGIPGMKWGVRKKRDTSSGGSTKQPSRRQLKKQQKAQSQFHENYKKNWYKSYNRAADEVNRKLDTVNKKYEGKKLGSNFETKAGQKYVKEVNEIWQKSYKKALTEDFGPEVVSYGSNYVKNAPMMNVYADFIKD